MHARAVPSAPWWMPQITPLSAACAELGRSKTQTRFVSSSEKNAASWEL